MSTLSGGGIRERVGNFEEEKTSGNQTDCVGLPDPALLDVKFEGKLHEHGAQRIWVPHLSHSKTSVINENKYR